MAIRSAVDPDLLRRYDRPGPRYTSYPTAGGTPNFLSPAQLQDVVDCLRRHFLFSSSPERNLSIELDPRFNRGGVATGAVVRPALRRLVGTHFIACLKLAARMHARGQRGSIVSLLCDRGERYDETLFNPAWIVRRAIDITPWRAASQATLADGRWHEARGS